jgi:hypothetical protein
MTKEIFGIACAATVLFTAQPVSARLLTLRTGTEVVFTPDYRDEIYEDCTYYVYYFVQRAVIDGEVTWIRTDQGIRPGALSTVSGVPVVRL